MLYCNWTNVQLLLWAWWGPFATRLCELLRDHTGLFAGACKTLHSSTFWGQATSTEASTASGRGIVWGKREKGGGIWSVSGDASLLCAESEMVLPEAQPQPSQAEFAGRTLCPSKPWTGSSASDFWDACAAACWARMSSTASGSWPWPLLDIPAIW